MLKDQGSWIAGLAMHLEFATNLGGRTLGDGTQMSPDAWTLGYKPIEVETDSKVVCTAST